MKYFVTVFGREHEVRFERTPDGLFVHLDQERLPVDVGTTRDGPGLSFLLAGQSHDALIEPADGGFHVQMRGERARVEVLDEREKGAGQVAHARDRGARAVKAPMAGVVVDVKVAPGQTVVRGQSLVVVEAMKMQNALAADQDARVKTVHVKAGQPVNQGQVLVEIEG